MHARAQVSAEDVKMKRERGQIGWEDVLSRRLAVDEDWLIFALIGQSIF